MTEISGLGGSGAERESGGSQSGSGESKPRESGARESKPRESGTRDDTAGTPPPLDPGAAAQRTRLAWRRTLLSAAAVALLEVRPAFDPAAGGGRWVAAAGAMLGWSVLVALAYRRVRGLVAYPPRPGRRTIVAYALTTVALAAAGGLVVML